MPTRFRFLIVVALVFSVISLAGCGDTAGTTTSSVQENISSTTDMNLTWVPPDKFSDNTPLDPERDLSEYAIYVNDTGYFSETDQPTAVLAATSSSTGEAVTSFNLMNLGSLLRTDVRYYIAMKSVSNTGASSGFSPSVSFTL